MTLLKKIGQLILEGAKIVGGFAPMIEAVLPGQAATVQVVSADLAQLATIVTQVEAVGQAINQPGTLKLTAAAPLVAQVILSSSVLVGKQIANQALFNQACTEFGGAMADLLNSLDANGVQAETSKAA